MSDCIQPLVSVLVCAYNAERYIQQSIGAIMAQTYKNLEIIIVNDGSIDSTLKILDNFAKIDNRIKIINNENNLGFISSLNIGLDNIKGEYVARTDADDITKPHWIETLVSVMQQNTNLMAIGSYLEILSEEGNGSLLAKNNVNGQILEYPLTNYEIKKKLLFGSTMAHPTMLIRSSVYQKFNLRFNLEYKYAEDYKHWLDISRLGELANYPEALVYYRLHENQTSSKYKKEQDETAKKIRLEAISYYFSDMGIKTNIIPNFSFHDVASLQTELMLQPKVISKDIVEILYDLWFSLNKYSVIDFFIFIVKFGSIFSFKQKRRIFKRFIFPKRYESRLL